jgi:phage terminase small subunit
MGVLKNAKHEHFAQLVAKGETPPRAYVLAGYSDQGAAQSANRLLKSAYVSDRLEELRKTIEEPARERAIEKAALDKSWVLSQLMENVSMAKAAEPVLDREGKPTGEYKQNLNAANKALELLGKELGMFIERRETGGPGDFAELTDEELDRQLADADAAIEASGAITAAATRAKAAPAAPVARKATKARTA